ncbi:MAG: hypothetical protein ABI459_02745 [Deltaproteobacteria bacterium]
MMRRLIFLLCLGPVLVGGWAFIASIMALTPPADPVVQILVNIVMLIVYPPVLTLILLRIVTRDHDRSTIDARRVLGCSLLLYFPATLLGFALIFFGKTTPSEAIILGLILTIGGMAFLYNYITTPKYKKAPEGAFE